MVQQVEYLKQFNLVSNSSSQIDIPYIPEEIRLFERSKCYFINLIILE